MYSTSGTTALIVSSLYEPVSLSLLLGANPAISVSRHRHIRNFHLYSIRSQIVIFNFKKSRINGIILSKRQFFIQNELEAKMIKIEFTEEEVKALNYERYHHPHPRVQRKMEALWLKSQGEPHKRIAQLTGISINVVSQYVKEYKAVGMEKLQEINFYKPQTELASRTLKIETYF